MRFWFAVAVLIGLVALGLATVPRAIDWNAYRSDVEAAASRLSGHDVTIGGPIEVTLLPRPVLTARDVRVTGRTDEAIGFALAARQAEVAMEIGPLLVGRPVIRDLRLRRPVLTVDAEGGERLRSWPPRWQDWASPVMQLELQAVGIADGRIEIMSDRPDGQVAVSDLSFDLRVNGPTGPLEAAGLFKTRHHRFAVTASVARPDKDDARAARLSIEARNGVEETTDLRFSGRIMPFGDRKGVSGRLTVSGPDLQHGLAAISAATGYPSTFRSIGQAQTFAIEGKVDADQTGVRADDLQLKLAEKLGKGRVDLTLHPQTRLDLDVDLPTLRLADDAGLADFLPLDLLSKLDVPPGEIDIRLRELAYRGEAARKASIRLATGPDRETRVERARAELPGLIDLQFEGELYKSAIGPRLRGRLEAIGDDLKSSLVWMGLVDGGEGRDDGWRSFGLEGDVDVSSVEIALSAADMRLASSRMKGRAALRFSERRRFVLDVDIDRPHLDSLGSGGDPRAAASGLLAHLGALDTDIALRFKRAIWQGVHVEEGSIIAQADAGRLTLDEVALKTVGDTTVSLKGEIDLDQRVADLDARLQSQHPARALRHLKLDLPLTSSRLRPLKLTGSLQGTFERFDLGLEAGYDEGEVALEGQAGWIDDQAWYDLSIDAGHPDHQALAAQFGLAPLEVAGDAEGPFELAGRLRSEAALPWILSGSAKLGPTTFTGSLAYEDRMADGPFEAKLSVGAPQKDSLAPLLILSGVRLAGDWTPARWLGRLPGVGLRTAWLDKVEGSLDLASKGGLAGERLTMKANIGDGLLYVERLEASPWQGRLQAEITLERRRHQPFVAFAVDLDRVEAADFSAWLGVKSGITGPLDVRIEASSAGRTPFEMVAGMAGDVEIDAGPGELEGLGIPGLREAILPDGGDAAPADRSLTMAFSEMDAKAALSRGILTFEEGRLVAETPSGDASKALIGGTADLLLWIADLTLTATPDGADTADGADGDTVGLYRIVGPPDRPDGFRPSGN